MCGEIEVGRCEICGKENVQLERKYYRYPNVQCECHSQCHFEIVRHCKDCKPVEPKEIKVILSAEKIKYRNNRDI